MYRFGFIIEQALGHVTHTENLQRTVPDDPSVQALWGLVPWEMSRFGAHVPIYNSNWTVRAGIRARAAVARLERQTQLDALFFHTQVPAIFSTGRIKQVPSIVSLDATPLQYDALGTAYAHNAGPAWIEYQKWRLNRNCFRAARKLVTWSQWAKDGLVADYEVPEDKVVVIPPGVDPEAWRPRQPRRERDSPVKVLFVGADLERKGGRLLLEAFRTVRELGVELHLVTRGMLPDEPEVFVHRDVAPNSDEIHRLFDEADIFCLPTLGDCLPMVLSEAGAAELPLVATRVAAIPEIVQDGETGYLVPTSDVDALSEALRGLVLNPERRIALGRRARELVAERHDVRRNARTLLDLLKATVDEACQRGHR